MQAFLCALLLLGGGGGVGPGGDPSPSDVQHIIKTFVQHETDFAVAREQYTYTQTSKMVETNPPGGSFQIVEDVTFDDRGRRTSRVVKAPVQSLQNIVMTQEDEQDLRHVFPFVMTNDTINQYNVTYLRREKVDELSCYVFHVTPKELTKDRKRYFDGDAWVDDQDLQIVKTFGRGIGYQKKSEDQQFPRFETYREQIDGKYWFPTYTYADDTLNFKDGQSQRVKLVVRYSNYKRFKSEATIQYGGEAPGDPGSTPNSPPGNTTGNSQPAPTSPPKP